MIVVLGCSFKVAWLGGETLFVYRGSIERCVQSLLVRQFVNARNVWNLSLNVLCL